MPILTSQKVINAINEQIGYEFNAELQYYAITAHFPAEASAKLLADPIGRWFFVTLAP